MSSFQLRLVLILSPSRLTNSFAGTFSGRIFPCSFSMTGKMMQWKTILSLPIKCTSRVSLSYQYGFQSLPVSIDHCLVAEIYPIGASNHTYSTFPSASFKGTFTPQSRSRVTALGCRPPSIQLRHCPTTFARQSSLCPTRIHSRRNFSYLSSGRYQCRVLRFTGGLPLSVLCGSISISGLKDVPQFSHWSP